MKFQPTSQKNTVAIYIFLVLAAAAIVCYAVFNIGTIFGWLKNLLGIVSPIILGAVIAYLCNPVTVLFENKVFAFTEKKKPHPKLKRGLSVACTFIVIVGLLSVFIGTFIPQLVSSYTELSDHLSGYISSAKKWCDEIIRSFPFFNGKYNNLDEFINTNELSGWFTDLLSGSFLHIDTFVSLVVNYSSTFVSGVSDTIIGVMLSIYFLLSKEKLAAQRKKVSAALFRQSTRDKTAKAFSILDKTFGGYIKGALIDALFVGFTALILMSIFRIPFAPLVSFIVGITNIIPYFGPFIGAIPSAFIILISAPSKVIPFVILILVIQQIDGNFICPRIMNSTTGLDALWVIAAITVGGGLFGFAGMLLSIPAFATIKIYVKEFVEGRLVDRGSPPDTLSYYREGEAPEPRVGMSLSDKIIAKFKSWLKLAWSSTLRFFKFIGTKIKGLFKIIRKK